MNAPQRIPTNPLVEFAVEYGQSLKLDAPWETNAQGQIIMNPPIGFLHADRADRITSAIKAALPSWKVLPELGLHTTDGIKAPDLSVAPPEFKPATDTRGFLLRATPLCVEIMPPSNSWLETQHKTAFYLAAGANEVWICDEEGDLRFFDATGETAMSALLPTIPNKLP